MQGSGAAASFDDKYSHAVGVLKLIQGMSQLGNTLNIFKGGMIDFAHKRPICGKWFLATDARQTKYCGGLAPGDKRGRTCRQIGNLKGREQRDLADDHPIKAIYTRRMNTITQYLHRGTLDEQTATLTKRLAKNKMERAISDHVYAKGSYEAEMLQEALLREARRR